MKNIRIIAGGLLLFTCFLTVGQNRLTHQFVFDTLPFIPGHRVKRLEVFAQEPMNKGKILFLGNSITEGGPWAELTGDPTVINRGIGGDIAHGVLTRMDEVIDRKPSKLFLMIGVNDLGKDIPGAVIADKVRQIIERVQKESPKTEIFLQSILPVNPEIEGFPQHYDKGYQILMTNQLLYKVAVDAEVTFINLYPYFLDARQRLREDFTTDGLHLSRAAYELWVNLLNDWGYL
ncbi:MAG: GDSL-type esterase/lipase family protein [Cyclobacteriaceae bacterium]|nr:GDSL-type esterase/lipase family protein [Cyclobacteriaceae bacterium]